MPRLAHNSSSLKPPIGPFSHAVRTGELIYLSGQVGQDPTTGQLAQGLAAQTAQIFQNVSAVLRDLGLDLDDVQKVNVYLVSMADFSAMNEVYATHFTAPFPARTTVAVHQLPMGALVEMEMVARTR